MPRSPLARRLALTAGALLTLAGCDAPGGDGGAFSFALSGARTARFDGAAEFDGTPCRVRLRSGSAALSLMMACPGPDDEEAFQTGSLRVTSAATDSTAWVSFYDDGDRRAYRGTGGTVEITAKSPTRLTGRFDVEAHRLGFDNRVDTTGTPLRIVGTFDAHGFAGPG